MSINQQLNNFKTSNLPISNKKFSTSLSTTTELFSNTYHVNLPLQSSFSKTQKKPLQTNQFDFSIKDNLDLHNLDHVKLIRTPEDEEFSQILKKSGQSSKIAQTTSFSGLKEKNMNHQILESKQNFLSDINKDIINNVQETNNFSKKLKKQKESQSSCATPGENWKPEFFQISGKGIGSSGFSFCERKKKGSTTIKKNLFFDDDQDEEEDYSSMNMTLEQFSKFSFERNPFVSGRMNFEQSGIITKSISLESSQNFSFMCPICFYTQDDQAQNNQETAKKLPNTILLKQESENLENTIDKYGNESLFQDLKFNRKKFPCFCKGGFLGWKEFYSRFQEVHMSGSSESDTFKENFRYLVWRLSSLGKLSIEQLYYRIEYRVYLTNIKHFSPFLLQLLDLLKDTKEQAVNQFQTNRPMSIILFVGSIENLSDSYKIELTDSWSSVYKIVQKSFNSLFKKQEKLRLKEFMQKTNDEILEQFILDNKIFPGQKLRIANLTKTCKQSSILNNCNKSNSQNIISKDILVELEVNGIQKCINASQKIGYLNKPFFRSVQSIKQYGGLIPCLDVLLLKKYPLMVQYFVGPIEKRKKIVTYAESVSKSIVGSNKEEDFFFAKILICDSLLIYDKGIDLNNQPNIEVIVKFAEPNHYHQLCVGERIRIFNSSVEQFLFSQHYSGGYMIILKAWFEFQIRLQKHYLTKGDFLKTQSFYVQTGKNLVLTRFINDLPECLNSNSIGIFEFNFQMKLKQIYQNSSMLSGIINYQKEVFNCDIYVHHPYFLQMFNSNQLPMDIKVKGVHFKSINNDKKLICFKSSMASFITI